MNEVASSVEPEVKTRFATVDDAAFERPQMQFRENCELLLFLRLFHVFFFICSCFKPTNNSF
jgi:hypothetical protein